jgi:hypothetical protein
MNRGLGILWVVISLLLPWHAGAEDVLYSCFNPGPGDLIDRGFYIEGYTGLTLNTLVLLYTTTGQEGNYTVTLTAHQGTYDGPVLGSSSITFDQTGGMYYHDFQHLPINSTMTIAFVQTLDSAPLDGLVYFDAGSCELGDTECATCPGIVETEDTTPPLSTFRRKGVRLAIWGEAITPVTPDSWGGMKALYR